MSLKSKRSFHIFSHPCSNWFSLDRWHTKEHVMCNTKQPRLLIKCSLSFTWWREQNVLTCSERKLFWKKLLIVNCQIVFSFDYCCHLWSLSLSTTTVVYMDRVRLKTTIKTSSKYFSSVSALFVRRNWKIKWSLVTFISLEEAFTKMAKGWFKLLKMDIVALEN